MCTNIPKCTKKKYTENNQKYTKFNQKIIRKPKRKSKKESETNFNNPVVIINTTESLFWTILDYFAKTITEMGVWLSSSGSAD